MIDAVSLSFRYSAGYTGAPTKKAPTASVVLLDLATKKVLKVVGTTGPLGNYSFDHFTTYSPPQTISASGLNVADDKTVVLALQVSRLCV
jgi:hypothetical protein